VIQYSPSGQKGNKMERLYVKKNPEKKYHVDTDRLGGLVSLRRQHDGKYRVFVGGKSVHYGGGAGALRALFAATETARILGVDEATIVFVDTEDVPF
jgi:hypothetical protein